jgi:hypothetical protein
VRRICAFPIATALTVAALAGASAASAATEVGSNCLADAGPTNETLVQLARAPGASLPISAPTAGVVTKWTVNLISIPGEFPQTLKVLRPTANPKGFTVITESAPQPVVGGANSFDAQIPVQAGDRFGLFSTKNTLYCSAASSATDIAGKFTGNATVGSTPTFTELAKAQVAVAATIEPDVDGDGYGDETQDKCPQVAAFQVPCPVVTLGSAPITHKSSVLLLVATSSQAPVSVAGTVKVGKGKPVTLSGGAQTVAPGKLAQFALKFSKKLSSKLAELSSKQSLKLAITATATDSIGRLTTSSSIVKLKGQG